MRWTERRETFRSLLARGRCLYPASVYDPLSARLAQEVGYEVAMLAGSSASLAVLGWPDITLLTLSELAEQTRRICRAMDLPLLIDADHGYGNALNVRRTIEELEMAGAAAITIEDTALPAGFGEKAARLIPLAEGVGKMKAALSGRGDPALSVIARTSALVTTDLQDALARLTAYEAAGVDALFLAGLRSRDQLDAVAAATRLPLLIGGIDSHAGELPELAGKRVRICLQGHHPLAAAVRAMHDTMKALHGGTPASTIEDAVAKNLIKRISRAEMYADLSKSFLGT